MARRSIDVAVVRQLRNGDMAAFDSIYSFYKDSIYFFSLSLVKNETEAEDIVQEIFMKVILNIKTLRKDSSFHSWVFTLAYNQSMTHHRLSGKVTSFEELELEQQFVESDVPTKDLDNNEILRVTLSEINKLAPKYIQIAQLYYLNELSIREVANILSIPKSTVGERIKYIEVTLQNKLEKKGYSPEKYFSLGLVPLIHQAFFYLQSKLQLSEKNQTAFTITLHQTLVLSAQ